MKVLFTADIHVKLNTKNIPNEWALNRYRLLFADLLELEKSCDITILGGDIWDKLPNMEELALFCEYIAQVKKPMFIIDGNHEATTKGNTFFSHLKALLNNINPLVIVVDDFYSFKNIDFIPYCKLKEFAKDGYPFTNSILITHCRGSISPHVNSEVPLEIFERWKVVLAGDLHSYENCQRNLYYPGSPITTSFHRSKVESGVIILDTETLEHEFIVLKLPQLLKKTVKASEPTPSTDYDHTIYDVEGDMSELGSLQDNDLVSKRIVKRSVDTALMLEPEMALEEEVSEYLKYILEINEESIETILQELADHVKKA